jgi:hypothetical protein
MSEQQVLDNRALTEKIAELERRLEALERKEAN